MTQNQLREEFRFYYNQQDTGAEPDIANEEIVVLFNDCALEVVKTVYRPRTRLESLGYEQNQISSDALGRLAKQTTVTATLTSDILNVVLPDDYLHLIAATHNGNAIKIHRNHTRDHVLRDPFNKPNRKYPIGFIISGFLEVRVGPEVAQSEKDVEIRYIARPPQLSLADADLPSEIPEDIQKEIIQLMVNTALESNESPRIQTQTVNLTRQK